MLNIIDDQAAGDNQADNSMMNRDSTASLYSDFSETEIQRINFRDVNPRSSRESTRLTGTVKWYNVKAGYGFVTRHDTGDDIFVHLTGIGRKNPRHLLKSLGDGEIVEFNLAATNVTGLGGRPVRGNAIASNIPVYRNDSFASGDPSTVPPTYRYLHPVDSGNSRIPRYVPNWVQRR